MIDLDAPVPTPVAYLMGLLVLALLVFMSRKK
jgi:hypothetical protein